MNHTLRSARLRVPDLDASVAHLTAVLGLGETARDATSAALALPGEPVCLELVSGPPAIESMTLRTDAANLAPIADRAETVLHRDERSLRLMAPHGVIVELDAGPARRSDATPRPDAPQIAVFDHLSFTARDLDATVRFFCDVLGFRLSDRVGQSRYWLRCNANHHTVAVFAGEDGLQHYAFAAPDVRELQQLGDVLAARGQNLLWGIGRHGLGENVFSYHRDPAGAILEVCSDMVQIPDEDAWSVGVWSPDTTASAIRWGQLPPPEFRSTWIPSATEPTPA
jgi:catechol 2,3-dioxygenase